MADIGTFILIAVKHEASDWSPRTIAREVYLGGLLDPQSDVELNTFRDEILERLVGRRAERFWANDAITPSRAAAIRSACQALHQLTLDTFREAIEDLAAEASPASPS